MSDTSIPANPATPFQAATVAPTKGRTVHYVLKYDGEAMPAIVLRAHSPTCVDLHVLLDPAQQRHESSYKGRVEYSPLPKPGSWHWPQRV